MADRGEIVAAYERSGGNMTHTATKLGIARGTVHYHLRKAGYDLKRPLAEGSIKGTKTSKRSLPKKGDIKRYILTSAQNNTHVHEVVWANIKALAAWFEAELCVGTYTYNKNRYGKLSVKRGKSSDKQEELWYDDHFEGYLLDERVQLAPDLQWCGEMNMLPTAVDPLNGFETYTGRSSVIFPHSKVAMRSIAAGMRTDPTKFNYTTGTVTKKNYVAKRAGLKAEFHHTYGASLVEVDSEGNWWVRQLVADADGTIYDLDVVAEEGIVYQSAGVEAITWGDAHELMLGDVQRNIMFDMLDALGPREQFIHDVLLGSVINHWDSRSPHERVRQKQRGGGFSNVLEELQSGARFLMSMTRPGTETYVVDSNHDRPWIERWLQDDRGMQDPSNSLTWHKLNVAMIESIIKDPDDRDRFHVLEHAMQELAGLGDDVRFLREDESHTVSSANIECGMHGHLGPNGARGNPKGLSRLGHKANVGHYHSAGIWDGLYAAGTSARFDMGYTRGPGSWSHSHIITYPNGKRTIVTVVNGKWRAQ